MVNQKLVRPRGPLGNEGYKVHAYQRAGAGQISSNGIPGPARFNDFSAALTDQSVKVRTIGKSRTITADLATSPYPSTSPAAVGGAAAEATLPATQATLPGPISPGIIVGGNPLVANMSSMSDSDLSSSTLLFGARPILHAPADQHYIIDTRFNSFGKVVYTEIGTVDGRGAGVLANTDPNNRQIIRLDANQAFGTEIQPTVTLAYERSLGVRGGGPSADLKIKVILEGEIASNGEPALVVVTENGHQILIPESQKESYDAALELFYTQFYQRYDLGSNEPLSSEVSYLFKVDANSVYSYANGDGDGPYVGWNQDHGTATPSKTHLDPIAGSLTRTDPATGKEITSKVENIAYALLLYEGQYYQMLAIQTVDGHVTMTGFYSQLAGKVLESWFPPSEAAAA